MLGDDEVTSVERHFEALARSKELVLTHADAAEELGVPVPLIQTLVRGKHLTDAGPSKGQARVTRGSVESYARTYPARDVAANEKVVPIADVRDVLQLSRNAVSHLVATRRLAVVEISRRQYIGSASVEAYLLAHPLDGGVERLALMEVSQP